jgi:hypothetical protein
VHMYMYQDMNVNLCSCLSVSGHNTKKPDLLISPFLRCLSISCFYLGNLGVVHNTDQSFRTVLLLSSHHVGALLFYSSLVNSWRALTFTARFLNSAKLFQFYTSLMS